MTKETLQEANKLNKAIQDLELQTMILENMLHCNQNMTIEVDTIGAITIACDDELKSDVIDMILRHLNETKDNLEDALRLL